MIPTGAEAVSGRFDAPLGELAFDHGFMALDECPTFSLSGGGRQIAVEFLENYTYAQVFTPTSSGFVSIEPMTAPTNALRTGQGLRLAEPGQHVLCDVPDRGPHTESMIVLRLFVASPGVLALMHPLFQQRHKTET